MFLSIMPHAVKALCRAARQGDVARTVLILEQFPETLNERNPDGRTALIVAVRHGQLAIVELLLRRGAKVNRASHRSGATPVWHCAWKGEEAILRLLLKHGADPSTEATDCGTPLMVASQYGHLECARVLLDQGPCAAKRVAPQAASDASSVLKPPAQARAAPASRPHPPWTLDIDYAQSNYKCTALWWACRSDREDVVRLLLSRGADFTLRDWKGRTPLEIALAKNHPGCVLAVQEAYRALALFKYRTLHDAEQCLLRLPLSRTRGSTLQTRVSCVPACLRARLFRPPRRTQYEDLEQREQQELQLFMQHMQHRPPRPEQPPTGKEEDQPQKAVEGQVETRRDSDPKGVDRGEHPQEKKEGIIWGGAGGGGGGSGFPWVDVKALRQDRRIVGGRELVEDQESGLGRRSYSDAEGRDSMERMPSSKRPERGKKRSRRAVDGQHQARGHHAYGLTSDEVARFEENLGEHNVAIGNSSALLVSSHPAPYSSCPFTSSPSSSSSSCSSSSSSSSSSVHDVSSSSLEDATPSDLAYRNPIVRKRGVSWKEKRQQGLQSRRGKRKRGLSIPTAESRVERGRHERAFVEEITIMVSKFVLEDMPEQLFIELMALMR